MPVAEADPVAAGGRPAPPMPPPAAAPSPPRRLLRRRHAGSAAGRRRRRPPPAPAPRRGDRPPAASAAGAQPRLLVLRGQKRNVEYPIYEGLNFIGRADEKPVDIDLEDQEPPDRVWCSRQHACISFEDDELTIEDLNSANGTYVNRTRIYPGQKQPLAVNDIIQIGNVQMKVIV